MNFRSVVVSILLAFALVTLACVYIVLPEGVEKDFGSAGSGDSGWYGIATMISDLDNGGLHIDITIRNDIGDWSTMRAADGKPAILTTGDGESFTCETVFIGTGGHRIAPGFQTRGYTFEGDDGPEIQPLFVECADASISPGSKLEVDYISFIGELDYYVEVEEENKVENRMEVNLDEVVADLSYPVGTPIEGLIQDPFQEIIALSENVISLLDIQRDDNGFTFTWQNHNPSKFPLKTHIGIPPVIGNDGIIYGVYITLDIPDVPLTPAQQSVEWGTTVPVPPEVKDLYILLSVESNKPRTYLNYALDITDQ